MPSLENVGSYRRLVQASLVRVWENVFDWEHLPALHDRDFGSVELLERGSWGWRARVTASGSDRAQVIELRVDKPSNRYRVTTLEGPGTGIEVHTRLLPHSTRRTAVEVEFLVPSARYRDAAVIGERYTRIYERLWDQDEAMMMHRERALKERRGDRRTKPRPRLLGPVDDVRSRVPFNVTFGGERFRLIELEGKLFAHSVTCPHWLGPLDHVAVADGCLRCPWHGYKFDVRTGKSADGHGLSLASAPRVVVRDGEVLLEPVRELVA